MSKPVGLGDDKVHVGLRKVRVVDDDPEEVDIVLGMQRLVPNHHRPSSHHVVLHLCRHLPDNGLDLYFDV